MSRSPQQLRLHPAVEDLGWTGVIDEFNDAARLKNQSVPAPVVVTTNGTIIAGFGRWRSAIFDGRHEIDCIEYPITEDEALRFTLAYHQTRCGWNAFVRIRLALVLEPNCQQRALDNMRAGGKFKGSANLPEAQPIDVREEIARIAGVCPRNVSNVKYIIEVAHPRLIGALRDNTLTINRAIQFCKLPRAEQLEQFIRHSEERETTRSSAGLSPSRKRKKRGSTLSRFSTPYCTGRGDSLDPSRYGWVGINKRLFLSAKIYSSGRLLKRS